MAQQPRASDGSAAWKRRRTKEGKEGERVGRKTEKGRETKMAPMSMSNMTQQRQEKNLLRAKAQQGFHSLIDGVCTLKPPQIIQWLPVLPSKTLSAK